MILVLIVFDENNKFYHIVSIMNELFFFHLVVFLSSVVG